jgi:hypothetical protein
MKKLILMLCLLGYAASVNCKYQHVVKKLDASSGSFAVCELFTSEGCSSCPPAEALMKALDREYAGSNVYLLQFHIDYWDKLGWKDKYDNAAYSKRQYAYNSQLNTQAYTPQLVINGKQEMIGSESAKVHTSINQALKNNQKALSIAYTIALKNAQAELTYAVDSFDKKDLINVALVEKEESNEILAGENKGHTLQHVDIVRKFISVPIGNSFGKLSIDIPSDLKDKPLKLVVYTQNHKNLNVTSATALNLGQNL